MSILTRIVLLFSFVCCLELNATSATSTEIWPLAASAYGLQELDASEQTEFISKLGYQSVWVQIGQNINLAKLDSYLASSAYKTGKLKIVAVQFNPMVKNGYQREEMTPVLQRLKQHQLPLWLHVRGQKTQFNKVVEYIKTAALHAAEHQVQVVIYPHAAQPVNNALTALKIVKQLNLANLKLSLIWCHEVKTGSYKDVVKIIKQIEPYLALVAISGADRRGVGGNVNRWRHAILPLGQGDISLSPLLSELKKYGYNKDILLKAYGARRDSKKDLAESIKYWQSVSI